MIEVWKILTWLIPIIGIPGLIALVLIYPGIMAAISRAIMQLLSWVLSSRLGCAILAAVAMGFAVDYWRHSTDDAEFAQRTALFEHAQKQRDERIRVETRDEVWTEIANQTAANNATDTEVKEFHNALPPIPHTGNPFRVGVAAPKLRSIAGQAERRSQGVKRMPAPRSKGRS